MYKYNTHFTKSKYSFITIHIRLYKRSLYATRYAKHYSQNNVIKRAKLYRICLAIGNNGCGYSILKEILNCKSSSILFISFFLSYREENGTKHSCVTRNSRIYHFVINVKMNSEKNK